MSARDRPSSGGRGAKSDQAVVNQDQTRPQDRLETVYPTRGPGLRSARRALVGIAGRKDKASDRDPAVSPGCGGRARGERRAAGVEAGGRNGARG